MSKKKPIEYLKLHFRLCKMKKSIIPKIFHNMEIRHHMFSQLNQDYYEDLFFAVISDLLYFLPIRLNDILPSCYSQFDPTKQVCRDGVFFRHHGIIITWKNEDGVVTRSLPLLRGNSWYDTADMMERMFTMSPTLCYNQPLFTRVQKGKSVPVLRSWFTTKYKQHVEQIGLDPEKHTWSGDPDRLVFYG